VLRTVRAMGRVGVAVFSDADAAAPHVAEADEAVRLGPAVAAESYLSITRLLDAAVRVGADAVHPGYGFLSENAELAAAVADAGLVFIGPPPAAIRAMGSKIAAKRLMRDAGVPVVPGVELDGQDVHAAAREVGFPILVKASAGGGGRGMRVVREPSGLADAVTSARREAESAFGDGTLLLERYLDGPRHIEVQVLADAHGTVVHCFERECSIQRRHQKVIEEAPSVAVDAALRARLGEIAVRAARAVGYVGAGTVELILDAAGDVFFLEMNTRLQVEHPVTEAITGLDLVRLQIEVAEGRPLPFAQDELRIDGHAIEARLYAEDAAADFLPATGRVRLWAPLDVPGVRWDSGVETGTDVPVHYDSMLAKIIAHAPTRAEATARLVRALDGLGVAGLQTNRDFLLAILRHAAFVEGALDTHFVERHLPPEARRGDVELAADVAHAIAAAVWAHERRRAVPGPTPASIPSGWRNVRGRPQRSAFRLRDGEIEVAYVARPGGGFDVEVTAGEARALAGVLLVRQDATGLALEIDGVRRRFTIVDDGAGLVVHGPLGTAELTPIPRFAEARAEAVAGGCAAPMTGVVRDLRVAVGDRVDKGAVLIVLEAMKMEHEIVAQADGVVTDVRVEVGQMVDPDMVLIVVEAAPPGAAASS